MTVQALSLPGLWGKFRAKVAGRKFVQDVGILTIANFVGAGLSFIQGILVARRLGPELYGVAALVMSYPSLISSIFDARSCDASIKFLSEFHAHNERDRVLAICKLGYAVDFAISSLALIVVVVSAHWAARNIANRPEIAGLITVYALAFIVPQALAGTSRSVLSVLGRFELVALVEGLTTVLRVVLVLGLVISGWQVTGVVWGNAVAMVATGLLYGVIAWVLIRRTWGMSAFQGDWQALKGRRREILGFLAYSDLNALLGMIPKQLDVLLLGYFRSPVEVGYYKVAKSLSGAVSYLVGPLQSVTYPEFARLSGFKDKQAVRQEVRRLAFYVGVPLGLITLAGTSMLSFILPIFAGEAYLPAVAATQLLLIGTAIWLTFFWLRPVYFSTGNIKVWTVAIGIYAIAFLLFSIPLTLKLGYVGMTIASSLAAIVFHAAMATRLIHCLK